MSTAPSPDASAIRVSEVRSPADRSAFVRFPWKIYAGDPAWVPPLLMDRKDFINPRKHPFHRHGAAALLLARRGQEVVGRILVSDDPNFNALHGTNEGCFGLFETVNDPAVAHALLEAATRWLRERGRTKIVGPIDYSTNYQVGLLIDGFETPPRVMMNHNPPWYAPLLESWGLVKAKDVYAWWVTDALEVPERWRTIADRMAARSGVTIRPIHLKDFRAELDRVKLIYSSAWEKNWGAVKMTDLEFDHLAKELKLILDPDVALLAEVDGKAVGFSLALPDINEALLASGINGRLFPFGIFKLLRAAKKVRTLRLVILGVLEGYRRRGITEKLIMETIDRGMAKGYTACEMGWTLEDNLLINRPIEALGAQRYKTYRVYERPI